MVEERTQWHTNSGGFGQARHSRRRYQRVSAQMKEIIVEPERSATQDVSQNRGYLALGRGRRGPEDLGGGEDRRRQRTPVEFSVGGQRNRIDDHEGIGNHVGREGFGGVRAKGFGVHGVRSGHIGHESAAGRRRSHDGHGVVDSRRAEDDGVDLAEFDPESADLDLRVAAPEVLELSGADPSWRGHRTDTTAPAGIERIGDEPAPSGPVGPDSHAPADRRRRRSPRNTHRHRGADASSSTYTRKSGDRVDRSRCRTAPRSPRVEFEMA